MKIIDVIAGILVIIGALNWGLFGAFNMDVVAILFGKMPMLAKTIYILIGLAGLYEIFFIKCIHSRWCDKRHHPVHHHS